MDLVRPVEVTSGVYQLRALGAKVTVIIAGDEVLLVDTGGRGSLPMIVAGLQRLGLTLGQVRAIALTHYHPDHAGGLRRLVGASGAKVAVHSQESRLVEGQEPCPSPFRSHFLAKVTAPVMRSLYDRPSRVDLALNDGDTLPFSETVQVIHAPGHTVGSTCLYMPSRGLLIVGDALQYRFHRLSPPAPAVTQDRKLAAESMGKLLSWDYDTICFSHFPPLKGDARERLRRLVERATA